MLLRKLLTVLSALLLTGGLVWADELITVEWDPPTHRAGAGGDCLTQGAPLTQAEIDSLEYTLSYRRVGAAEWTNVDTQTPLAQISLTGYEVDYEFSVGARWPGGTILCATDIVTHTTAADTADPGQCSDPRITRQP